MRIVKKRLKFACYQKRIKNHYPKRERVTCHVSFTKSHNSRMNRTLHIGRILSVNSFGRISVPVLKDMITCVRRIPDHIGNLETHVVILSNGDTTDEWCQVIRVN